MNTPQFSQTSGLLRPLAVTAILLTVSACTILHQQALDPIDWVDRNVERLAITNKGSWARLQGKPLQIGEFTATSNSQWSWRNIPVETTSDLQIGVNPDNDHSEQISAGTSTKQNESALDLQLSIDNRDLAQIRCREFLKSTAQQAKATNSKGSDDWRISRNIDYSASLNCRSQAIDPEWPQWQMELQSIEESTPLNGQLTVNGVSFEIVGSRASNIGIMPETVSYEVRKEGDVLALIDLSEAGQLSIATPVGEQQFSSIVGAAAVLFLASDPLSNQ